MKVYIGPYPENDDKQEMIIEIDNYDTWSMDYTLAHIILPMLEQLKETKHGSPMVDLEDVPENLWPKEKPSADNNYTDSTVHERWEWVMNEMIWAFKHKVDDDWDSKFFKDEEPNYEIRELKFKGIGPAQLRLFPDELDRMEDYELYEWERDERMGKFDAEGYKKYHERISNGFRLFGKYYEGLWD